MSTVKLTDNDRHEIELFKQYLRAKAKWDNEHDELPDFAPVTEKERVDYERKRTIAHMEIYKQIYGETAL